MGFGKWIKKQLTAVVLATGSVEENMLSQGGGSSESDVSSERSHKQGTLSDALSRGELTQEVRDLRWRMYKVLDETSKFEDEKRIVVIGYEEDGTPIVETKGSRKKAGMSKIRLDDHDDYKLELVVNNDIVMTDSLDFNIKELSREDIEDTIEITVNPKTGKQEGQATIGEISGGDYESSNKAERILTCTREFRPKFELEMFTKKMNVRTISKTEKLLEFYVSKYPNQDDRKSTLFLSEVKKVIKNPRAADFLDIATVEFVSYNTIGVRDLHDFEYKITGFDKLIEYDGYYVVKFKSEVVKDGLSLIEQFREDELDERYKNKERKKGR
jgi:hypothetical protein